jgi:hypothetical protein
MQHLLFGLLSAFIGFNLLAVSAAQEKGTIPSLENIHIQDATPLYPANLETSSKSNSGVNSDPQVSQFPSPISTAAPSAIDISELITPTIFPCDQSNGCEITPTITVTITPTPEMSVTPITSPAFQLIEPIHTEPTTAPLIEVCNSQNPKLPNPDEPENPMVCL